MAMDLRGFNTTTSPSPFTPALLEALIDSHERTAKPRQELLWSYYRNPMVQPRAGAGRYTLAQERGLPARLLGASGRAWGRSLTLPDDRAASCAPGVARKEIVIENDIAWRIHAMVDFLLGRPVVLASTARDPAKRRLIERVLDAVWESSGGIALLQDLALLANVFGHVDLVVRAQSCDILPAEHHDSDERETQDESQVENARGRSAAPGPVQADLADPAAADSFIERASRAVRVEIIEPTRGIPLVNPRDYRAIDAYIIRYRRLTTHTDRPGLRKGASAAAAGGAAGLIRRLLTGGGGAGGSAHPSDAINSPVRKSVIVTEVLTGAWRAVYEQDPDDRSSRPVLIEQGPALVSADRTASDDAPAAPPIVHIQNLAQPFAYEGLSEVEPLVPLQDELNTRLSDRASRVTLQSFKMILAKGLGDAQHLSVAPGVIWQTDNPDARVESFGGDASSPSEERHIDEIREAMDKVSGVPPLAAGVVRAKIGNLSSENALRVTLMGLINKTARKRITYGRGIADASRLILEALDRLGILHTDPADRAVRVEWPDPLPKDEREALDAAVRKIELGVPRERVLAELGYSAADPVQTGVE